MNASPPTIKLYTQGFTRTTAEAFFTKLRQSGARRIIDVRLHNTSQLAGFAKRHDLCYFLRQICDMDYIHLLELAPTNDMLQAYRARTISWPEYAQQFMALLHRRKIEDTLDPAMVADSCLLCSEHQPHHCHRRLVAEYLNTCWGRIDIVHIV